MTKDQADKKDLVLRNMTKMLLQHFDVVRIFAEKHDVQGQRTFSFTWGGGSINSQVSLARDWVGRHDATMERDGWDGADENDDDGDGK